MPTRPHTDLNSLVKNEVVAHMKPFIEVTLSEHENTRKEIRQAVQIMKMASRNRVCIVILAAFDVLVLGAMVILHI